MPIYEYVCKGCGCEYTRERRVEERGEARCPWCGKMGKKAISGFNFITALKWSEDRREHFAREFEKRRIERPRGIDDDRG